MFDLKQEFEKRFGPLRQQAEKLQTELDGVTSDNSHNLLIRQLKAKVEMIGQEILRLTSEAEFGKVEKKEAERNEIQARIYNATSERDQKIDGLKKEISSLLGQKNEIAEQVLREAFAELQKEAWSRLGEAVDFIDLRWKEIEKFHMETGATAAGVTIHNLKIYQNSNQRELWQKISKFVHIPMG
jgi:hypothetical protein